MKRNFKDVVNFNRIQIMVETDDEEIWQLFLFENIFYGPTQTFVYTRITNSNLHSNFMFSTKKAERKQDPRNADGIS